VGIYGLANYSASATIVGNSFIGNGNETEGVYGQGANASATIGGAGADENTFTNFASLHAIHMDQGSVLNVLDNQYVNSPNPIRIS
jgi:hypothetical protein